MEIKTLGIKILKGSAQFAAKAVWFLLCKGSLAILLVMGFIAEAIASSKSEDDREDDCRKISKIDLDPQSEHYLHDDNSYLK